MKKLVVAIGLTALGAAACTSAEEEASLHVQWSFAPTDGCIAGETIWFQLSPDPFGSPDIFNCLNDELSPPRQEGTLGAIPLGDYSIRASVHDGDDPTEVLPAVTFNKSFDVDGQVLEQMITFARGFASYDVSFRYDFGGSGFTQNCADADSGTTDAGVINQTVDLMSGSQCLMVTMTGTDQTGTPFSEDTCGSAFVCNEQTVVHTVADLDPGPYTLTITGYKMSTGGSPIACYASAYTFDTATATTEAFTLTGPAGEDPLPVMFMDTSECNATLRRPIDDPRRAFARD
jgi:hypothetical protein